MTCLLGHKQDLGSAWSDFGSWTALNPEISHSLTQSRREKLIRYISEKRDSDPELAFGAKTAS